MKKRRLILSLCICLGLVCALGACSSKDGDSIKVGKRVAAMFGSSWYLAKVTKINGDKYDVHYDDGTDGTVEKTGIKVIPVDPKLKVGDKVMAVWGSAKFYDGEIQEVKDTGFVIKWSDGSAPSEVKKTEVIRK